MTLQVRQCADCVQQDGLKLINKDLEKMGGCDSYLAIGEAFIEYYTKGRDKKAFLNPPSIEHSAMFFDNTDCINMKQDLYSPNCKTRYYIVLRDNKNRILEMYEWFDKTKILREMPNFILE